MTGLLDLMLAGSRVAAWVGVLLVAVPAGVLLALAVRGVGRRWGRRAGRVEVPHGYWHPSMGPQRRPVEPVTELLPRCADSLDATVVIPRQRTAVGGGRRG